MEKCRNLLRRSLLDIASLDPCLRQGQDGFASEPAGLMMSEAEDGIFRSGFMPRLKPFDISIAA